MVSIWPWCTRCRNILHFTYIVFFLSTINITYYWPVTLCDVMKYTQNFNDIPLYWLMNLASRWVTLSCPLEACSMASFKGVGPRLVGVICKDYIKCSFNIMIWMIYLKSKNNIEDITILHHYQAVLYFVRLRTYKKTPSCLCT